MNGGRCVVCGMPAEEEIAGVGVCARCFEAHQEGTLRLIREDHQIIIMNKTEDGSWSHRTVPLVDERPMPLYEVGEWSHYLANIQTVLRDAPTETLKEYFWELERMEGATFVARCSIVHELYERAREAGDVDEPAALRYAARVLEISYIYARELHMVYENIVRPLQERSEEIPDVPPSMMVVAAKSARKHGVDPVKAVKYAAERVAEDRSYRRTDFVRDIKEGLPEAPLPEPEQPPASCMNCVHMRKAGGDCKLVLMWGDKIIAEGPGEGIYYCERIGLTKDGLLEWGDFYEHAQKCQKEGLYVRRTD